MRLVALLSKQSRNLSVTSHASYQSQKTCVANEASCFNLTRVREEKDGAEAPIQFSRLTHPFYDMEGVEINRQTASCLGLVCVLTFLNRGCLGKNYTRCFVLHRNATTSMRWLS